MNRRFRSVTAAFFAVSFGAMTANAQQLAIVGVTATGCNPTTLTTQVTGATPDQVMFYYYLPGNNTDGTPNSARRALAAFGSSANPSSGTWSATWESGSLTTGNYQIGVMAAVGVPNAFSQIVWSFLDQAEISRERMPSPPNIPNPAGMVTASFTNSCGQPPPPPPPPPSLVKQASASSVTVGGPVEFMLTVKNPSPPITVSSISDILPAGFTYTSTGAGTIGVPTTSPGAGTNGTLTWTFAPARSVPAGQSLMLVFTATATSPGTYSNSASAVTSDGNVTSNPVTVDVSPPQLTISETASVTSANPGDPVTFTITYSNPSASSLTNSVITDVVPPGITFVASPTGSFSANTVTWTVGSIAAGAGPFSVSYTATVNNPFPTAAAIPVVNTATIRSSQTMPASASSSISINVPRPALAIQKTAPNPQVAAGSSSLFTINYANVGNAVASGVVVSDPLPNGFTYVGSSPAATTAPAAGANGIVTWNVGSLAAVTTGSVRVVAQAGSPFVGTSPATNTVTISAPGLPSIKDSYTVGVSGSAPISLVLDQQVSALSVSPGASLTYTIQFTNSGTASVTGAQIVDALPAGVTIVSATLNGSPVSPSVAGQQSTFAVSSPSQASGVIAPGATGSGTLVINGTVAQPLSPAITTLTNNVQLTTSGGSPVSDSAITTVISPTVTITKAASDTILVEGETVTYTLTVLNSGTANATNVTINDALPANAYFTYVPNSAQLNQVAIVPDPVSGSTLNANIGSLAVGASASITFRMTVGGGAPAGFTNLMNTAAVSNAQRTGTQTSNGVIVTIGGNSSLTTAPARHVE